MPGIDQKSWVWKPINDTPTDTVAGDRIYSEQDAGSYNRLDELAVRGTKHLKGTRFWLV